MNWAREIMAIRPELEEIAKGPVELQEYDYGWSVSCGVAGRGVQVFRTQYQDPKDGQWYALQSNVRDYIDEEQLGALKMKRLTADEAKDVLRNFVRSVST